MLKIVTDGGADFPENWQQDYEIHVLPLRIRFGDHTYVQGIDIDKDRFYKIVEESKQIPRTSLPSPAQIVEFYRNIALPGDSILSIHLGSRMSGTYATVELAAIEVKGEFTVYPYDSCAGSAVMAFMCREARLLDRAGASIQEILRKLTFIRDRLTVIFTLDSLDFARMNGRVNALQGAITSILRIKPIIILRDGLLQMGDKVRTRQRSIEQIVLLAKKKVEKKLVNVAVVHAADPATAQILVQKIREIFNIHELFVTELAIPVAANLGPGTVGIIVYPVEGDS
jgi:DegV family protein with EDD domain